MNSKSNTTNDDILNEIIGIEYEDDDALTLLDDEEMSTSVQNTDEDLDSFYLDYQESKEDKNLKVVDLYTEEVVKKEQVTVAPTPNVIKEVEPEVKVVKPSIPTPTVAQPEPKRIEDVLAKDNAYQSKLDKLSSNIDAYLNGSLENRKDTVKVEKMEPVVVKAPTVETVRPKAIERPVVSAPPKVEQVIPTYPSRVIEPEQLKEVKSNDTNINQLFAKVSDNVRGASDVKKKMEERFRELQRLYDEFEKKKKAEIAEINAYREDVNNQLRISKQELDERARRLKLDNDVLINQKKQFEEEKLRVREEHKRKEQEMLKGLQEREKNIEQVEAGLIRRKEQLDAEKSNIAKEREQVAKERKELADNLVKFNQLVDDFTNSANPFNDNDN